MPSAQVPVPQGFNELPGIKHGWEIPCKKLYLDGEIIYNWGVFPSLVWSAWGESETNWKLTGHAKSHSTKQDSLHGCAQVRLTHDLKIKTPSRSLLDMLMCTSAAGSMGKWSVSRWFADSKNLESGIDALFCRTRNNILRPMITRTRWFYCFPPGYTQQYTTNW